MNRGEKIQLLKDLQTGVKTIAGLKSNNAVLIYKDDVYHVTGTSRYLSQQEFENYITGMKAVLLLPDNGRSGINW
jgi:hypothetical protein